MNHVTKVKLLYALYTPFQNIKLAVVGIKTRGLVFTGGSLFVIYNVRSYLMWGYAFLLVVYVSIKGF